MAISAVRGAKSKDNARNKNGGRGGGRKCALYLIYFI